MIGFPEIYCSVEFNRFYTKAGDLIEFPPEYSGANLTHPKNFKLKEDAVATFKPGRDLIFGTESRAVSTKYRVGGN